MQWKKRRAWLTRGFWVELSWEQRQNRFQEKSLFVSMKWMRWEHEEAGDERFLSSFSSWSCLVMMMPNLKICQEISSFSTPCLETHLHWNLHELEPLWVHLNIFPIRFKHQLKRSYRESNTCLMIQALTRISLSFMTHRESLLFIQSQVKIIQ